MKLGQRKFARMGLTICAMITFSAGAKMATLLPVTDAGSAAWAQTFSGAAIAADNVEDVPHELMEQATETEPDSLGVIARERALLEQQKTVRDEAEAEIALARDALRMEADRLEALKTEVTALLAKAEARHEADVKTLVDLYGGMKPKEAAGLLMQMDLEVAIYVLTSMDPRRGAPILAEMPPRMAQAISRVMLERGKLPGDQQPVQVKLR